MARVDPETIESLAGLRAAIDEIDDALMVLLAERLRYADRAPVLKRRAGVSAAAPSRQRDVVERVRARAEATGFDPALAEAMWRVMIDGIVAREERVIGKEGTDG